MIREIFRRAVGSYVGAHYPTDVIFGTMSGIIISIVVYLLVWKKIEKNDQYR